MASAVSVWNSLSLLLWLLGTVQSFYFPEYAPNEFKAGDSLFIKAGKLTSVKTQLPYQFYDLPYCEPKPENAKHKAEYMREYFRGYRTVNTPYKVKVLQPVDCAVMCSRTELSEQETNQFVEKITDNYTAHLLLDNLPVATVFTNVESGEKQYEDGFRVGFVAEEKLYLNNHLHFVVDYHSVPDEDGAGEVHRIVGFQVVAQSIAFESQKLSENGGSCKLSTEPGVCTLTPAEENKVLFTYSVEWVKSDMAWASRWDTYLRMSDVLVHWFAICNCAAIVLFLSGIFTFLMTTKLRKHIATYNRITNNTDCDSTVAETGWKLVHGVVFRHPNHPMRLWVFLGLGIQIFCMVLIMLIFAIFGILSPTLRGALMAVAVVLFMFMELIAGYSATHMYCTLKSTHWKRVAGLMARFYPRVVFGVGFFLNFFIWDNHSFGAVPFTTMLALLTMWFGISFPLMFIGFYIFFGIRRQPYQHLVRNNLFPRQILDQLWWLTRVSSYFSSLLPFVATHFDLGLILFDICENKFHCLFGFIFLFLMLLLLICSEGAIFMIYLQLCRANYRWWWKSFFLSGSCAYYVLGVSAVCSMTRLEIEDFIPTLLYVGYTGIMVFGFWLITGSIGFYATYYFNCKIYAAVKQCKKELDARVET